MGVKWSKGHLRARGLKGEGAIRTFSVLARCVCNQSQEKMYFVIVDSFNTSLIYSKFISCLFVV